MSDKKKNRPPITLVSLDELIELEHELYDENDPLILDDWPEEMELDFNSDVIYPEFWKDDNEE